MKVLINYANDVYKKAQDWNSWTGKHIAGFDKVYAFSPNDIDKTYYETHKDILSVQRGNGSLGTGYAERDGQGDGRIWRRYGLR